MAIYNITNAAVNQLDSRITDAKAPLESRRALWESLSPEQKAAWRVSCPDPVISRLYALYLWLKEFFGE